MIRYDNEILSFERIKYFKSFNIGTYWEQSDKGTVYKVSGTMKVLHIEGVKHSNHQAVHGRKYHQTIEAKILGVEPEFFRSSVQENEYKHKAQNA